MSAASTSSFQNKLEQLQKRINYKFRNPSLLQQALTRQNAIQEQHPDAHPQSFQALEFVGDAALKHVIARLLDSKYDGKANESQLHTEAVTLICNDGVLPKIAKKIKLDELIIKGKGESSMTSNILADSMEALLGAISIDCENQQKQLFDVIKRLWWPYIEENQVLSIISPTSPPIVSSIEPSLTTKLSELSIHSESGDYQRLFCGASDCISIVLFQEYVRKVGDINRRSTSKEGNPVMMMLLQQENLRKDNELPKIKILLEHGADWNATNNKGISADQLASLKHGGREAVLRKIEEL